MRVVAGDDRCVDDEQPRVRLHAAPVRHVLFDADGVLQDVPGGWEAAARPYLGERAMEFLRRAWDDELPALAGQAELLPLVGEAARRIGADPAAVLFIDDSARNVTAAREAGLAAEQWTFADGHATLLGLLAKHGVASA